MKKYWAAIGLFNFNILGEYVPDSYQKWPERQPFILQVLQEESERADIITLQELRSTLPEDGDKPLDIPSETSWDAIIKNLSFPSMSNARMRSWPVQPRDIDTKWKNVILYNRFRFTPMDQGVVFFKNDFPLRHWRQAAWIKLYDGESKQSLVVINTHWLPYCSNLEKTWDWYQQNRTHGVQTLTDFLATLGERQAVLMAGDFNDTYTKGECKPTPGECTKPGSYTGYDCTVETLQSNKLRPLAISPSFDEKREIVDHVLFRNMSLQSLTPREGRADKIKLSDHTGIFARLTYNGSREFIDTHSSTIRSLEANSQGLKFSLTVPIRQTDIAPCEANAELVLPIGTENYSVLAKSLSRAWKKGRPLMSVDAYRSNSGPCIFNVESIQYGSS